MANILIGVCGGIAAYKVAQVVSSLAQQDEDRVKVVMSDTATAFVSALTFATLAGDRAYTDQDFWQADHGRPLHIELGEWAEIILVAPLTAHTLAKLATGMADNLLTNVVLASSCPIAIAPAMNPTMWWQETVQQNWSKLLANPRYHAIAPTTGRLACDAQGVGRMAEPDQILTQVQSLVYAQGKRDLVGKQVLVTAGATKEYLDPVRFLSNPASGKQGIAIAQAAYSRGAKVILILAARPLPNLPFQVIGVDQALEMAAALAQYFATSQITIMAAAVGDLRPRSYSHQKLPKSALGNSLFLEPVPDLVAELSKTKTLSQIVVGFAAQTGSLAEIETLGRQKLKAKNLDAIAINSVNLDQTQTGFGAETNQVILVDRQGRSLCTPICSKLAVAHHLLDFVAPLITNY
ncbi:MAG: bifunctional phosphopantothenoylcysteine decarboxylase/phosphopantothenate--cysteine ligase CoaBC [Pseudanabaenaceae cyanobacterium bins.68]|nr:bifunctional phosphopantothenoylcysteine decarboxylase/phosphopantothenate--cysteine ligase CoaBC [Pseudanabaenaceae cyanobacterium bins.68]